MQLDLSPADDVIMEVDPDYSLMSAPLTSAAPNHASPASSPNPHHHPLAAGISSPVHPMAAGRTPLDAPSATLGPLPAPPVMLIWASDSSAWPKFKLDQLFVEWLARPESRKWLESLLEAARKGKALEAVLADQASRHLRNERSHSPVHSRPSNTSQSGAAVSPQTAPGSPISRLFSNHVPFDDTDSSPRSPPSTPAAILSPFKPVLSAPAASEFDLGRTGFGSHSVADAITKDLKTDHAAGKVTQPKPASSSRESTAPTAELPMSTRQVQSALAEMTQEQPTGFHGGPSNEESSPDNKTLDKVADGIAGMTADTNHGLAVEHSLSKDMRIELADNSQKTRGLSTPQVAQSAESAILNTRASPNSAGGTTTLTPGASGTNLIEVHEASSVGKISQDELHSGGRSPYMMDTQVKTSDRSARREHRDEVHWQQGQDLKSGRAKASTKVARGRVVSASDIDMGGNRELSVKGLDSGFVSAAVPPPGPNASRNTENAMTDVSSPWSKKPKSLPRFYFPCGKDAEQRENNERQAITDFFQAQWTQKKLSGVSRNDITTLVKEVIGLPSYFSGIILNAIQELFPHRTDDDPAQRNNLTQVAEGEETMRDVDQEEEYGERRPGSAGSENSRAGISTTNSDTTMGDVDEGNINEARGNGVGCISQVQRASEADSLEPGPMEENKARRMSGSAEMVSEEQFTAYYDKFCAGSSKESRLFSALREPTAERDYLIPSDFKPLLHALLVQHQGLAFLHATPEFQQRYSETVIERIYFGCTRQHNGRLTLNDIKRSKLLETLMVVDEEEDINRERKYFSYEHFYVLYCRFWELDANHDLQIDREDLMRYGSHSLTYRIVDRIFGGYARPLDCPDHPGYMSYTDFIWFCLSEEDKTSETAIDYWFRCIDMDGDGLITLYDLEHFYKEQLHRMECFGHEPVQIRDILCQLLDMISPNVQPPVITRRDLKKCRLAGNFFNVLFNLNKFFAIEARDPLQIRQEHATPELTDWDRFAALEYLRLSAEEEGEEDESWDDVGDVSNPLMAGEAPF